MALEIFMSVVSFQSMVQRGKWTRLYRENKNKNLDAYLRELGLFKVLYLQINLFGPGPWERGCHKMKNEGKEIGWGSLAEAAGIINLKLNSFQSAIQTHEFHVFHNMYGQKPISTHRLLVWTFRSSQFSSSFALGKLFASRNRQCPRTNILV